MNDTGQDRRVYHKQQIKQKIIIMSKLKIHVMQVACTTELHIQEEFQSHSEVCKANVN